MYVSLLLPFPGLERGKKYIYFGLNKITEHLCWDNYCYTGSVWQWKWRHLTLSWRALFNLLPACKSDCLPGRGFFFFSNLRLQSTLCKKYWLQWRYIWAHIFFSFSLSMSLPFMHIWSLFPSVKKRSYFFLGFWLHL